MPTSAKPVSWVVYRMKIHGKEGGMSAVCEQAEWEAIERAEPGRHTLVLAGIANEGEAERRARSDSVDRKGQQDKQVSAMKIPIG